MDYAGLVSRAKAEVRGYAESLVGRVAFFTRVSATTADGQADGVEGWPADDGDPDSGQETARRMEPWGVHGRPATGIQALIVRALGGATQALMAGIWTNGYGRQNLDKGETQIYCIAKDCEVYLDKNGNLFLKAPATKKIVADADTVYLGKEAGSNFVALSNLVLSQLQSIQAQLTAHTHTGVQAGVAVTGPSNSTYVASAVAATNVKAK